MASEDPQRTPGAAPLPGVAPAGKGEHPRATADAERAWAKLLGAAWEDETLKRRLKDDPRGVLKEYGIRAPEHLEITVHESRPDELHITLPARPKDLESLSEEDLLARSRLMHKCFC